MFGKFKWQLAVLSAIPSCLSAWTLLPHYLEKLDENRTYQFGINYLYFNDGNKDKSHLTDALDGSIYPPGFKGDVIDDILISYIPKGGDKISNNLNKSHIISLLGGDDSKHKDKWYYEKPHILSTPMNSIVLPDGDISIFNNISGIKVPVISENLAPYELRHVDVPQAPAAPKEPKKPKDVSITITGAGANPSNSRFTYWGGNEANNANYSNISQVNIESGTFIADDKKIDVRSYKASLPYGVTSARYWDYSDNTFKTSTEATFDKTPDGVYDNRNAFFYTLLKNPYSYFSENTNIHYNEGAAGYWDPAREFLLNFETEGVISKTFDQLRDDGDISQAVYDDATNYRNYMPKYVLDLSNKKHTLFFDGKGLVEIGPKTKAFILTTTHSNGAERINIVDNSGRLVLLPPDELMPKQRALFFHSPDTSQQTSYVYANSGKMDVINNSDTALSYAFVLTSYSNSYFKATDVAFINDGEINLYGKNNIGIGLNHANSHKMRKGTNFYLNNPINILSDDSFGLYNLNNDFLKSNDVFSYINLAIGSRSGDTSYTDLKGDVHTINNKEIDGAFGIVYESKVAAPSQEMDGFVKTKIDINQFANNAVGIYPKNGTLKFNSLTDSEKTNFETSFAKAATKIPEADRKHEINILGGKDNSALVVAKVDPAYVSNLEYYGDITIKDGIDADGNPSIGNKAIVALEGGDVKFSGNLKLGESGSPVRQTAGIYSNKGLVTLQNEPNKPKTNLTMYMMQNSSGLYAKEQAAGGVANIKVNPDIDEMKFYGVGAGDDSVGVYSDRNGLIDISGVKLSGKNLASVLVTANGGDIDATGATISYDGDGYALYSDADGSDIILTNATINLTGNSVGLGVKRDTSLAGGYDFAGVKLNNTTIGLGSKNAVAFTIQNLGTIQTSNFTSDEGAIFGGDLANSSVYTINRTGDGKYANLAIIEGLTDYIINTNIDKNLAGEKGDNILAMTTNDEKISFNYAKGIKAQNAKVTLKDGYNVSALMSDVALGNLAMDFPYAVAMTSSKFTDTKDSAQIILEGNNIINVDSASGGKSGVGLYINFGKVDTASTSTINVGSSSSLGNGTGIYAISSDIKNRSSINLNAKDSVGILSYAYKVLDENGNILENEFSTATNSITPASYTSTVLNSGVITTNLDSSFGIYMNNNSVDSDDILNHKDETQFVATNQGTINTKGKSSAGMIANHATVINEGFINVEGDESAGIFGDKQSLLKDVPSTALLENRGVINLKSKSSAGILNDSEDVNSKVIMSGTINSDVIADGSVGISAKTIDVIGGATIDLKSSKSAGVYADGSVANIGNLAKFDMGGDESTYVYINNINNPSTINWNHASQALLQDISVGVYAEKNANNLPNIINIYQGGFDILGNNSAAIYANAKSDINLAAGTKINILGDKNYGIIAKNGSSVQSYADIDMSGSSGSVGILTKDGGDIKNYGVIKVGNSDVQNSYYSVGMAIDGPGRIENHGTIDVVGKDSIGMYARGTASTVAANYADIVVRPSAENGIAMYTDGATIENHGTIALQANNSVGAYMLNGSVLKNYGTFKIENSSAYEVFKDNSGVKINPAGEEEPGKTYVPVSKIKITSSSTSDVEKGIENLNIKVEGYDYKVTYGGKEVLSSEIAHVYLPPVPNATTIDPKNQVNAELDGILSEVAVDFDSLINQTSVKNASETLKDTTIPANILAMYADTSGVQTTKPISGLENLPTNSQILLYVGPEATYNTNAKVVSVEKNIISPFIDAMDKSLATQKAILAGSLTWQAFADFDTAATNKNQINSLVLAKVPYTAFVDKNSKDYKLYEALEEKYSNALPGTPEKEIFNKISSLGKNEEFTLHKAFKGMAGNQYAGVQTRAASSADVFAREFDDLMRWDTNSTDTTKFKAFGHSIERKAREIGLYGFDKDVYGVFVLNNHDLDLDENSHGWFAGIAHETYDFKDAGDSEEKALTAQIGYYINNALELGDRPFTNHLAKIALNGSYREMERNFYVNNQKYTAKGDYYTYGIEFNNLLYKDVRFDNGIRVVPYMGLDLAYGKISNIKEDSGPMQLEIDADDYYSIRPNFGVEVGYTIPISENNYINASLDTKLYKELGKINEAGSRAKFRDGSTYYGLHRDDEEDENVEITARVKYESRNFGVGAKAGYNTKYQDSFIGLDFRLKF